MERNRIEAGDGRTVVHLFGDVDMAVEAEVTAMFADAVRMGQPVVVDASEIDFVDSTGMRILLIAYRQCADAGLTLALRKPSADFERMLEIGGLDTLIPRVD